MKRSLHAHKLIKTDQECREHWPFTRIVAMGAMYSLFQYIFQIHFLNIIVWLARASRHPHSLL